MNNFKKYLKELAEHEWEKSLEIVKQPRNKILYSAGMRLNWLGDYLANPKIKWQEKEVLVEKIQFTGMAPEWGHILIDKCQRSVIKFKELIENDQKIKQKFEKFASYEDKAILVRKSDKQGYYKVLDGMHRFVGTILKNKKYVKVYMPIDESILPLCEPHTIYDLIRGYLKNARDEQGKKELYSGLKLLARTYDNVIWLLENRFNKDWVLEEDVQEVILKVIKEN